jgi:hypothetical protein
MVEVGAPVELIVYASWLTTFSFSHVFAIAVFYLLWRLPGSSRRTVEDVFYDAVENLSQLSDDDDSVSSSEKIPVDVDQWIASQVKEATAAERLRFYVSKKTQVATARALRAYMDWRKKHDLTIATAPDSILEDARMWNEASLIALKARREKRCSAPLPQIAFMHQSENSYIADRTNHRIIHFVAGRMDDRIASTVTYALAVALYIDRKLDRESDELVTVVIDSRGGHGWRNLTAAQLLPFIQHLSKLLLQMFPERLYRTLVFPIPSRFFWVWKLARNCIDPLTREKICPLMGPSTIESSPPMDEIAPYLSSEVVVRLETERKSRFVEA